MSTLRKFAGQTAIYGLSTIVSRFLNFILTPIYVNVYPAKVYGVFNTLYSYASMLNALLAFGMETTFFRFLNKHEHQKDRVYSNSFIVVAFLALSFLVFTLLFADQIATYLYNEHVAEYADYLTFVKFFIYILVVDALVAIPFSKLRADGRAARYGVIKFVNILVFVGLNLFFIYGLPFLIKHDLAGATYFSGTFREGWVGYVFISNLIASLVTLVMLLPQLMQIKPVFDGKLFREMFVYSWPVLIANISFIINENVDKIFLSELLPEEISSQDVGIYGACAKVAIFLSIFVQAFRLGAEPFFFSHAKNANAVQTYARIMNFFVIAVAAIFIALVANIEILKYFIRGNDPAEQAIYWSGLDVIPVLLFGYVCLGIYINLSVWYKLSDQTRFGLYISGIGAILTVVLNLIFIPKYSFMAAAWVSLTAYTVMMILSYWWGQRNYPIPYNLKKIVFYLSVAAAMVFVSYYVFDRNLIIGNLLFVIFILTALFLERKELSLILRRA
ncbi:MAG TPA: polysaccharide biosynthesis C-terminal domain-containing protein [Sphingobacteriaceae bacterium]